MTNGTGGRGSVASILVRFIGAAPHAPPPLRHPAWLLVAIIACLGAALTTWMAGSVTLPATFVVLAAVFASVVSSRFRRMRGN